MTSPHPNFLVFRNITEEKDEDLELIYSESNESNVHWPKSFRRGRPKKDQKEEGESSKNSLKEVRSSKERYGFVNSSGQPQSNNADDRKFVRSHVMRNHQWQKRENQVVEATSQLILSPHRWRRDPFNSFPIQMQPQMHKLLYFYVSAAANYLYPIEANFGFNPPEQFWIPSAMTDPALLRSILFASQTIEVILCGLKELPSTSGNLTETFQILNKRLEDLSKGISDSTIAAVASLATAEQIGGNETNWRIHMGGVKQMIDMRGGLSTFENNPILHDKLCRADISGSIHCLSKPYLRTFSTPEQENMLGNWDEIKKKLPPAFQDVPDDCRFDLDLYEILWEVYSLNEKMKFVNPPKSEDFPMNIRKRLRSIQYSLLSILSKDMNDGLQGDLLYRSCALGILLYTGIVQNEIWISSMSHQLICQLKTCLQTQNFATDHSRRLHLWLSFLAGSLILDPTERLWFTRSIFELSSQLSLSTWCDTKPVLETFLWIGKNHDKPGQQLWDEAMTFKNSGDEALASNLH